MSCFFFYFKPMGLYSGELIHGLIFTLVTGVGLYSGGLIRGSLRYLFNLSIENGIFPDDLKIAKVTSIYKAVDKSGLSNYRPISVLSCFSKFLERIMYNHLHQYLTENKILYPQQFGFQTGHSTEHAIVHLVDQILESFEYNKYTLGVFIDLSKAFDTVDHSILLKKYGVTDQNH